MAMVIKPKRKFTAGAPSTSDIVEGEIAINTADKKLYVRDNANNIIEIGGGGAGGSTTEVTQNSHGFVAKDAIRHNGSAWVKAQANAASTLALGIVTEAATNTFTVAQSGRFEISSHGLTVGQWYYLSAAAAGGLVSTEPAISQPIVYVESSSVIFVYPYRPTNLLINSDGLTPGDNTVTSAKIVNGTIVADDLATNAITTIKITDSNVTTAKIADLNVTTGKIADDAVTLAKMAAGTDGNIISYDASGNPVAVATGNAGQILTSAGAGAPPTFQTPAAGGPSVGKAFFMGQL
tara:strand:+ start:276 stop:1154 length:879 start_codon:yes stop_codon:yes gene_type:complete